MVARVFFDRPRCILCYRCIRVCGEGMDVWALGVQGRGARASMAPNGRDHLDCEQCGMCIDICPVGALTSGSYRYKTRPWEMNHVSTVCTHCGDGCKVTLGVRQTNDGTEIVRANNRDKSGINGDFLCAKGRFGFDFVASEERLTKPLVRNADGKLVEATWEHALRMAAGILKEMRETRGGAAIGVIGSNQATNEENYLLQKFARTVLRTNNIDHERTADYAAFARALAGHEGKAASLRETATAPAILLSRRQSDGRASAAGLESAQQCAAESRAAVHRQQQKASSWSGRPRRRCVCLRMATRRWRPCWSRVARSSARLCWLRSRCW